MGQDVLAHVATPFRMQPSLARLGADARHLTPLSPASALFAEKQQIATAGLATHCVAGFDPSPALASITRQALHCGCQTPSAPGAALALLVEEDLAILDTRSGTVPWMCVCVPSSWAPEEKIGLGLEAIHAPVADNQALAAAWPRLAALLAQGGHWERHVWTLSPSPRYDQHPHRQKPAPWPVGAGPEHFAQQCYLRTERQGFFPVHDAQGGLRPEVVFTIRVILQPLQEAIQTPAQAHRLHDALQSMTPAVMAYKRLAPAVGPLLAWLAWRARPAGPSPTIRQETPV